jgi:hypothetical protein
VTKIEYHPFGPIWHWHITYYLCEYEMNACSTRIARIRVLFDWYF